ncbi:MAG: serine/threonine-protein kinase, partial [Planctomycetota bacterium]
MDSERFQRAKGIFAQALALSEGERASFLDEACAGDASLRAEVDSLLASDQKAAGGQLAQALNESGSQAASTAPGDLIAGRYRILALLGRGGMGEVYLAEDLTLGQQVALKFLSGHIAARPGGMERFLDEVRVARRVGHPNVARVHDVGEADGRHFLSMEYVSGEDLSQLLKRIGRLPREKAQEIARQLCAGLDAIHSMGILHRDLKPANVMLDGEGNVRITDFGLAASAQKSEAEEDLVGTPAYMAPEQLEGQAADERSEIFSLGLLLYELFTGRRAFKGGSFLELKDEYAGQPPSSPSSVISDFDPEIEDAILACLRKNPQDRPPSVRAVALSLPGGDPLAAAVAAGKTPAPEIVANAADS